MKGIFGGTAALAAAFLMASGATLASDPAGDGVESFRACYATSVPAGMTGAPELTIDLVVAVQPEKTANGTGTVTWGAVGPAFDPIEVEIEGPWYYMCTMDSCAMRLDFASAPGAKGLHGMLVAPNWGSPGKFKYEFEGGTGEVEQDAVVCD
ncbi:DUF1842 domain-containing protein [Thiococcus pfennigii]|jgi:hypothetical protein|uniref:DUF1842 domain-containing protein n=1 Tax=Thiococcus pfennigii TaxID=1057 RepID=UPI0019087D2B|nr:DUF1842 domain-containing protein [Thiococcus pfennigii]MBK1700672.1 hypothetical protein [Thiococcus pfennigii]MBK1730335.1 hypothetical protein [Thiococcus pfennigii]